MRKSLGEKRKELSAEHIGEITKLYGAFEDGDRVKILPNEAFGFLRVPVERPLRRRWVISDDTFAALGASKAWVKWDTDRTPDDVLSSLVGAEYATEKECSIAVAGTGAPTSVVKHVPAQGPDLARSQLAGKQP